MQTPGQGPAAPWGEGVQLAWKQGPGSGCSFPRRALSTARGRAPRGVGAGPGLTGGPRCQGAVGSPVCKVHGGGGDASAPGAGQASAGGTPGSARRRGGGTLEPARPDASCSRGLGPARRLPPRPRAHPLTRRRVTSRHRTLPFPVPSGLCTWTHTRPAGATLRLTRAPLPANNTVETPRFQSRRRV